MIPIPGKFYALLAVVAVVAVAGFVQHLRIVSLKSEIARIERDFDKYKAEQVIALADAIKAAQDAEQAQTEKVKEVTKTYESQIADVRARYKRQLDRVRRDATSTGGGAVSEDSSSSGGLDASSPEGRFVDALRECEEDRERLRALQEWARTVTE